MQRARRPLAQVLLVAVAGSVFLTWVSTGSGDATAGIDFGEGRFVIIVAALTIGLVQLGWRPAWIGGGLVAATLIRQLLRIGDTAEQSAGLGLWLGVILSIGAAGLLIQELFASIERAPADDA